MKRSEYDYSKLKGRIKEKVDTQEKFANKLGISVPSLVKKLNNKSQFTQTEINIARDILNIPDNELNQYFFSQKVKKT